MPPHTTTPARAAPVTGTATKRSQTALAASGWSIQTTPNPAGATSSQLLAVACLSATNCEAVGNYTNSSGGTVTLAERWS